MNTYLEEAKKVLENLQPSYSDKRVVSLALLAIAEELSRINSPIELYTGLCGGCED